MIYFFRLANKLEYIYRRKFDFQYYMNVSFFDYDHTFLKELDWMYGELIRLKTEEDKKVRGE